MTVALWAVIDKPLGSIGFGRAEEIRCSSQDGFKFELNDVIHAGVTSGGNCYPKAAFQFESGDRGSRRH